MALFFPQAQGGLFARLDRFAPFPPLAPLSSPRARDRARHLSHFRAITIAKIAGATRDHSSCILYSCTIAMGFLASLKEKHADEWLSSTSSPFLDDAHAGRLPREAYAVWVAQVRKPRMGTLAARSGVERRSRGAWGLRIQIDPRREPPRVRDRPRTGAAPHRGPLPLFAFRRRIGMRGEVWIS